MILFTGCAADIASTASRFSPDPDATGSVGRGNEGALRKNALIKKNVELTYRASMESAVECLVPKKKKIHKYPTTHYV